MYVIKIYQIGVGVEVEVGWGWVGVRVGVGLGLGLVCCVATPQLLCCAVLCCDVVSWLVCACFSVEQHMDFSNPYPTR